MGNAEYMDNYGCFLMNRKYDRKYFDQKKQQLTINIFCRNIV